MTIVTQMLFKYSVYMLYMGEDMNLMTFFPFMFLWVLKFVHLPWILLILEFPLGNSETFLCFMLVNFIKFFPPPGVPLRQIKFVIK
jgi:hypothetical protein